MNENEIKSIPELFARLESVRNTVQSAIEACPADKWQSPMLDQERTVAVVFHHIPFSFPVIADWALLVASGKGMPPLNFDDIHKYND